MKKRAMKKWIPKDTIYCWNCKWRKYIKTRFLHKNPTSSINHVLFSPKVSIEKCEYADECKDECWTNGQTSCYVEVWRCEYMGYTDYNQDSLLWDGCKECGVHMPKDW